MKPVYSDGRRAKKFTHLLDDTKSSCSSSSSASHMAGSGVSYASTGLSGTTTSSVKLVNGEMNNNSKDSRKNVPSNFTSGLDEFDTSDVRTQMCFVELVFGASLDASLSKLK